ncbi:hypothetical protein ACS0TY_000190 [Phlomoides rotata]
MERGVDFHSTVSKTKPRAYRSISEALVTAPANRKSKYYIKFEAATYIERVEVGKHLTNIILIVEGYKITKVIWNAHAILNHVSTFKIGTITVMGDGFISMFILFENTFGEGNQADATVMMASHVAFYRCTFCGFQDTLYAKSGLHFYRECNIYGTVDFIFGAAAAVFQNCNIYTDKPRLIIITTQNKEDGPAPPGLVIQNCRPTVVLEFNF